MEENKRRKIFAIGYGRYWGWRQKTREANIRHRVGKVLVLEMEEETHKQRRQEGKQSE